MAKKKDTTDSKPRDPSDLGFFDEEVPPLSAKEVVAYINKKINEGYKNKRDVIRFGRDAANPFLLRRPTGLASIDCDIGGGLPAGGITQIDGPAGAGKDALAAQVVSTCQEIYGQDSRIGWCCLEHPIDKQHLRIQGVIVPSSDLDLRFEDALLERRGLPPLAELEIERRKVELGEFFVFGDGTHEQRLEGVLELLAQNYCQVIVIDSLGAASTEYRMKTMLDKEPKQAATAFMLSEFMRKAYPYLTSPKRGTLNLTTLIMTNQVRSRMNRTRKMREWGDASPHAIRHGKLLDITLTSGDHIPAEGLPQLGKVAKYHISKGKAGCHEGGRGELKYYFDTGFDHASDLFITAKRFGLILHEDKAKVSTLVDDVGEVLLDDAPWGPYGSALVDLLHTDVELFWKLYYACLKHAEVSCLHKL